MLIIAFSTYAQTAVLKINNGASITLSPSSSVDLDGFKIEPNTTYIIADNEIYNTSNAVAIGSPANNSIERVYSSTNALTSFSGTLSVRYLDGELNGNDEANLSLALKGGNNEWTTYSSSVDNISNTISQKFSEAVAFKSITALQATNLTSPCVPGVLWTAQTAAEESAWRSVTYGNGLFVAVAVGGTNLVMTSPDGISWTSQTAAAAYSWSSVTYGNGLFVAVTSDGTNRVMTSPDGITWTAQTAAQQNQWRSVTYGNGQFVAVAQSGTNRVMTSPDGITWTTQTAAEANAWGSITYGNGLFVAIASDGTNRVMTSPNGITWTAQTAAQQNQWTSITYGNGQFVAVASSGFKRVMTSSDGITWTAQAASEANAWGGITYGNGQFVAVTYSGTNRVMTSPDGITWTSQTAAEQNQWTSVIYGNGLFVAVANSGTNRVMTSGCTVTAATPIITYDASQISSFTSTFGTASTEQLVTVSGIDLTNNVTVTAPTGFEVSLTSGAGFASSIDITASGTLNATTVYVRISSTAVSGSLSGNILLQSQGATDENIAILGTVSDASPCTLAATWTAQTAAEQIAWTSVTYGNGLFVAVASTGTNRVMTSPDGITWTAQTAAEQSIWLSVTYGNGLFVAVARDGTNRVMTSPDGITWTAQTAAEQNSWLSVTYGNGLFVAVSNGGTNRVMTSPDGIIWTAQTTLQGSWSAVTYDNGLFVAIGSGAYQVMTSPDGIIWTAQTAAGTNSWYSITYGNGLFVAVASSGSNRVMTSPDGIIWTSQTESQANSWYSVTYGNGLFVAVASDGRKRVMTSPDGITWTGKNAVEQTTWFSVTYGGGRFVAVATNGRNRVMTLGCSVTAATPTITYDTSQISSFTSTFGTASTEQLVTVSGIDLTNNVTVTAPTGFEVSLTSGAGFASSIDITASGTLNATTVYVRISSTAVSGSLSGNILLQSQGATDENIAILGTVSDASPCTLAETWTAQTAAAQIAWTSVTYGNGLFVAVASTGTNRVMTSPDGITWTAQTAAEQSIWLSVTYGNGLFVAVARDGTNRVMTSPDGITWTAQTAAEQNSWLSVTYGNGLFVAVSNGGTNRVMTSPDGIIWTAQTTLQGSWSAVTYDNGLFVAIGSGAYQVMTSPDGIIWTAQTAAGTNSWYSITYGNGLFVAVASSGSNRVMTSPDGIIWTSQTESEANSWYSVTYGNGLFVAVANSGTNRVMTSPDGITWTAKNAVEQTTWFSVTYGGGRFVAISTNGTNRVMTLGCSVTAATPTITYDASQISSFTSCFGFTSAEQSVSISGTNLTNNVTVAAPTGFEVSLTSGSGFASSVDIAATGTLSATTVYVRVTSLATTGAISGTLTMASTGATDQTVSLSGVVNSISLTPASQTNIACNAGSNGSATVNTPTGGTAPYTYDWTGTPTGDGTASVTGLTAGSWTCTATDANGCTATQSFTITEPTALIASSSIDANVSCNGGSNGSVTASVSGGISPYSYAWDNTATTASITGLTAGTYGCTITDVNGCTSSTSVVITEPTALSFTTTILPGYDYNLSYSQNILVAGGSGTKTYSVTAGSLPSGLTLSSNGALTGISTQIVDSNFTITASDANSCTVTYDFVLKLNQIPITVTATASQTKVFGQIDPVFAYSVTPSLLSGDSFTGTLDRTSGEDSGNYTINVGTLSAGPKYLMTFVDAAFSITAKPITVTADAAQAKVYGATDVVFTYSVTPSLLSGDSFTGTLDRALGEDIGNYGITQGNLSAGSNYAITYEGSAFSITAKAITVTADAAQTKVYGTTDAVFTYSVAPSLMSGDSFTGTLDRALG
ncbi:beta strand repeat-containing protein, partial [Flavobacterium sp. W22_SRS_FP1]|uniref:beta strand repeat-containing protein n=1 Tax=Flavobacterium sp. W22_SRS_FP1 TaxID=3240276 RepID=UPI003F93900A